MTIASLAPPILQPLAIAAGDRAAAAAAAYRTAAIRAPLGQEAGAALGIYHAELRIHSILTVAQADRDPLMTALAECAAEAQHAHLDATQAPAPTYGDDAYHQARWQIAADRADEVALYVRAHGGPLCQYPA